MNGRKTLVLATLLACGLALGCSGSGSGKPGFDGSDHGTDVPRGPAETVSGDPGDAGSDGDATAGPELHPEISDAGLPDLTDTRDAAWDGGDSGPSTDSATDLAGEDETSAENPIENWPLGTVYQNCGDSFLAALDSPSGELRILVLRGSHYEMGHGAGCLMGKEIGEFFDSFIKYFTSEIEEVAADLGLEPDELPNLLFSFMNNLWLHMEPFVPPELEQEIQGFEDAILSDPGLAMAWTQPPAWGARSLVLLSNLSDMNWSGSLETILEKLSTGYSQELEQYYESFQASGQMDPAPPWLRLPLKTTCSFFAAWGPRTKDQHLLGSRNLDWSTDTGISKLKGLTLFVPDGGYAHAAIGYLGFPGALAGISEKGIVLSEVGSESVMERLPGQPWTLKFREILTHASDLDTALELATGTSPDGKKRPPTIGYNWMVAFGDPPLGTGACAAALETNGAVVGVFRHAPDCVVTPNLLLYDHSGSAVQVLTNEQDPFLVNIEGEAVEIGPDGSPKLFQTNGDGDFVLDANGHPLEASGGTPFPVGKPLDCALFRGDETLMHGVRRWQTAANGPQGGNGLMSQSGRYKARYLRAHDILVAYETGTQFSLNGEILVPENGAPVAMGLEEAVVMARAAAMGSNVMSIAYDATEIKIRVSFETGSGDTWQAAHQHPYVELDLKAAFDILK